MISAGARGRRAARVSSSRRSRRRCAPHARADLDPAAGSTADLPARALASREHRSRNGRPRPDQRRDRGEPLPRGEHGQEPSQVRVRKARRQLARMRRPRPAGLSRRQGGLDAAARRWPDARKRRRRLAVVLELVAARRARDDRAALTRLLVGLVAVERDVRRRLTDAAGPAALDVAGEPATWQSLTRPLGACPPSAVVVAPGDAPASGSRSGRSAPAQERADRRADPDDRRGPVPASDQRGGGRRGARPGSRRCARGDREGRRGRADLVPGGLQGAADGPSLTPRERQVLGSVVTGRTNAQIADQLGLAESTVKSHLSSAFAKLGVASRAEAAALIRDQVRSRPGRSCGRSPKLASDRGHAPLAKSRLDRSPAAMVQAVNGALGLAEPRGDLPRREPVDVAQKHDLPLLVLEAGDGVPELDQPLHVVVDRVRACSARGSPRKGPGDSRAGDRSPRFERPASARP